MRCVSEMDMFVKNPARRTGTMGAFVCRCIYTPGASVLGTPPHALAEEAPSLAGHRETKAISQNPTKAGIGDNRALK